MFAKSAERKRVLRITPVAQRSNRKNMKHNEIVLIRLYISLKVAKAKFNLFKETGEVPNALTAHIRNLKKEIMERENACQ
jgi:hypothetical protein